jgi:hypothetical protein
MTHPILALQVPLVAALRDALDVPVFDAPPHERKPPYVTIARHDVLPRDGDDAPGHEHRVLLHAWVLEARMSAVLGAALDGDELVVTLRRHERTDSAIDAVTGRARAALALTFFSEPAA